MFLRRVTVALGSALMVLTPFAASAQYHDHGGRYERSGYQGHHYGRGSSRHDRWDARRRMQARHHWRQEHRFHEGRRFHRY